MKPKYIKKFFCISALIFLSFLNFSIIKAETLSGDVETFKESQEQHFLDKAGLEDDITIGEIVATLIQAVLGFLAIIFVVLILYAGFKWMTAGGNEEQIKEARETIKKAIIGLIIIIAAYSITYFVFSALGDAAGGTGGPTGSP